MRLASSGRALTYWPSRKNVALTLCFLRVSSSAPTRLPGPSSKVSAMHFTFAQSTCWAFLVFSVFLAVAAEALAESLVVPVPAPGSAAELHAGAVGAQTAAISARHVASLIGCRMTELLGRNSGLFAAFTALCSL